MIPYKLIVVSLEGALLDDNLNISRVNRNAILTLKKNDIGIAITSSRPVPTIYEMLQNFGLVSYIDFIIGMNGGVVYDAHSDTREFYHLLSGKAATKAMHFFSDLGAYFYVQMGKTRYISKSTYRTRKHAQKFGETEVETSLTEFLKHYDVKKLMLYCEPNNMPRVLERAKHYYDDECAGSMADLNLFEFMNPRVNKGYAFDRICKKYKIDLKETIAIGNASSDIRLLKMAGIGVCLSDGTDDVKAVADVVYPFNGDEDAFAKYINDLIQENEDD